MVLMKKVFASIFAGRVRGGRPHSKKREQVRPEPDEEGTNGASAEDPVVTGFDKQERGLQNVTRCEEGEVSKPLSSSLPCRYFGSAKGCTFGDGGAYQHTDPLSLHSVMPAAAAGATFDQIDANQDGVITQEEFSAAVTTMPDVTVSEASPVRDTAAPVATTVATAPAMTFTAAPMAAQNYHMVSSPVAVSSPAMYYGSPTATTASMHVPATGMQPREVCRAVHDPVNTSPEELVTIAAGVHRPVTITPEELARTPAGVPAAEAEGGAHQLNDQLKNRLDEKAEITGREEEEQLSGREVILHGLLTKELNGRRGRVREGQSGQDRYVVDIEGGYTARVRPVNLRTVKEAEHATSEWTLWCPPKEWRRERGMR